MPFNRIRAVATAMTVAGLSVLSVPARPQDWIHSDLPLFSKAEDLWPRGFVEDDGWGCTSRIAFGDWKYVEPGEQGGEPSEQWVRLRNYGVFHCAVIEQWASERDEVGQGGHKYSWFVPLGRGKRGGSDVELWALQSGSRPGSDYLLLSRRPAPGLIKSFDVLAVDCPRKNIRSGRGPDIWLGDYCAINSARELRLLAQRMSSRTPVGTLAYFAEVPESEDKDD